MTRWIGLIAVLLALGEQACSRAPGARTSVVHLLTDDVRQDSRDEIPDACAVDDDIRPALGCVPRVRILKWNVPRPDGDTVRLRLPLPGALGGNAFVVERSLQVAGKLDSERLGAAVVRGSGADLELEFPVPSDASGRGLSAQAWGRPLPPAKRVFVTRPVRIGTSAALRVSLGIDPLGVETHAAPVEFRLVAKGVSSERELLRAVVDPAEAAARRWNEQRVDLGDLAGQDLHFEFATRVVPRPGEAQEAAFGFPLWGAPQILEPERRAERRNLVLISIDTLRADHVGAYGCDLATTPELDRLAAQGALFEEVSAAYPSTTASHMTMLTGMYPATHGVTDALAQLPSGIHTLAQRLAAAGYQTAAVTEDGMVYAEAGFRRGFAFYRENKGTNIWDASGQVDATFSAGRRWLEEHHDERFFLFLHTYQAHAPYSPPPEFDVFKTYRTKDGELPIDERTPNAVRNRHLYAGEVRYVDAELKKVLDTIDALGEAGRTIVVVTADHGEEFGEHGGFGHGLTLYDEALHVPLIVRAPGLAPAGRRIAEQASLADVVPTLLELLDLPRPADLQGESLVPLLDPQHRTRPRAVFAETWPTNAVHLLAVRTSTHKWIFTEGRPRPAQIFDLRADPGEHATLTDPELLAEGEALGRPYQTLLTAAGEGSGNPERAQPGTSELDSRTVEKLRALGYLQP